MTKMGVFISLGLCLAFLLCLPAHAETVSYQRPTSYVDGQPLPASAITGFEFRCTSTGLPCAPFTAPGSALSATFTVSVPASGGTVCVEGRTLVGTAASVYAGGTGAACKTFPPVAPNPPANITVAVVIGVNTSPAFTYSTSGVRSNQVAGFVAHGLPCVGACVFNYRGKCYRRVAKENVQWWATTPQYRVAAPCAANVVVPA